ncbi:MAG: hypothetical protein NTY22_07830 [Proteobacteria bacterium]|nr:hypothetical protein [Pseudomonadota bacterium]
MAFYKYHKETVSNDAPDKIGVYYCGELDHLGNLIPHYIGRALGDEVTVKSRLLDHLRNDTHWKDATHFHYVLTNSAQETERLEAEEIKRCKPKYNKLGK